MFPYDSPTHLAVDDTAGPFRLDRLWYIGLAGFLGFVLSRGPLGLLLRAETGSLLIQYVPFFVALALGALCATVSPLGYDLASAAGVLIDYARNPRRALWRRTTAYDLPASPAWPWENTTATGEKEW